MSRDTRLEEIIAISYLKLRLKQLLRLLTGVGLLRCLFLFLFLFLIFLLLIKVDRDWIVPAVGIGGLFFYHNERKDKDFLLISTDCGKSILSLEYLLLSFPFVGIALFKRCFLGSGFIVMAALLLSYMKSVHLRLPAIPVPFLCRGGLEYIRMFRMYALLYLVLLLVSSLAGLHGNIRVAKVLFLVWGLVQSMSFMSVPRRVELTMFRDFPAFQCHHLFSLLWNTAVTSIPFIVLILLFAPTWENALFCVSAWASSVFYLWNLGMLRWLFLSAMFMVVCQLIILIPLFFYACFFPLLWSVWVLITLLSYFYVKNDFRKLWN